MWCMPLSRLLLCSVLGVLAPDIYILLLFAGGLVAACTPCTPYTAYTRLVRNRMSLPDQCRVCRVCRVFVVQLLPAPPCRSAVSAPEECASTPMACVPLSRLWLWLGVCARVGVASPLLWLGDPSRDWRWSAPQQQGGPPMGSTYVVLNISEPGCWSCELHSSWERLAITPRCRGSSCSCCGSQAFQASLS